MTDYSGNELIIEKTRLERDLGVIVANDLKWIGWKERQTGY